jgi:nucleotide-binding universal stress UspA family protein
MFGFKNKTTQDPQAPLFRNLLLVVDGSEASVAAANLAVRMAVQQDCALTAVYVIDTATLDYLLQMRIFVSQEREGFERDLEKTGARYLEYVSTIARNNGTTVQTVLRHGSIHQEILKEARERGVDAIVLGGWKRTIARKDVASLERQHILDQADCPVVVVKVAD